jgi:TolA-binding protein
MRDMKRGVKTEDSFQRTMEKVMKFVVQHRETAIWIGVGVVVAIFAIAYLAFPKESVNPEAEMIYTQAISLINLGRLQEAENYFVQLTEKYASTRPGKLAFYYLGVISYHTARFNEALDFFDKFLSKERKDPLLTPSAQFGAGCAAEGLKDYERALSIMRRLHRTKNQPSIFWECLPGQG